MPLKPRHTDTHEVDPEDWPDPGYTTPDTGELYGPEEANIPTIPVRVEGPVDIAQLGVRSGGMFTVSAPVGTGATADAVKLLGDDPRRKSATIVPLDSDIYIGTNRGDVMSTPGAARWPAAVPLVVESSEELWASAVSVATIVTVVQEHWAR
jgi:hypothetical protein